MATPRNILLIGDARLTCPSAPVRADEPGLAQDIAVLHATLQRFRDQHGYGRAISAPQIGIMKRIIAMDLGNEPQTLINPHISWRSEETYELWDDCMSLPGVLIRVRRHCQIRVDYQDYTFAEQQFEQLSDDVSELLQHEIDHLDGILFTHRMVALGAIRARATMQSDAQ